MLQLQWRAGPGDSNMRRRDFIKAIVGSVLTCPHLARAQQNGRIRRIAALMPFTATDAQAQARNAAFLQGCNNWDGLLGAISKLTTAGPGAMWRHRFHDIRVRYWREVAGTAQASCHGLKTCGGHPGPLYRCRNRPVGAIQSVAPSSGVELNPINVDDAAEMERAIAAFAGASNSGMIVTGSARAVIN